MNIRNIDNESRRIDDEKRRIEWESQKIIIDGEKSKELQCMKKSRKKDGRKSKDRWCEAETTIWRSRN